MTVIGEAYVVVRPDSKGFAGQAEREVESGLGGAVKKAALLIGGALALGGAKEFVSGLVDAARESEKMAKQTAAVLASTGSAAGVSAAEVDKLATSLSNLTGIDDEAIQNNENLLLTFTNVKNRVGEGNDIFSQATKLTLDMSKALGTDGASASIQLGKALNDPIKGITALTRVGVSFTEQQKDQIKALVASGDQLGAQKIILAELNKEFGGSAEAQATAADRLAVTWDNVQETLGKKLLPLIDKVAAWLADRLPGAIDATLAGFESIGSGVLTVVEAFQVLAGDDGPQGFAEIMDNLLGNRGDYIELFRSIGETIVKVGDFINDPLIPALQSATRWVQDHWVPMLIGAGVALGLLTAPVTTVVAGLALLYAKNETVRNGVQRTIDVLRDFGRFVQDRVVPPVVTALHYLGSEVADFVAFFSERFDRIRAAVENVLKAIAVVVAVALAPLIFVWQEFNDQILAIVEFVWAQVQDVVKTAMRVLGDIFDLITALLTGQWGDAWDAIKDILAAGVDFLEATLGNLLNFVVSFFSSLPGNILSAVGDIGSKLAEIGNSIIEGIMGGVNRKADELWNFFIGLPSMIREKVGELNRVLYDAGVRLIQGLIDGIGDMFGRVKDKLVDLKDKLIGWKGPPDVDSVLLVDNGRRVIQGFIEGLESKYGAVRKTLQSLGASLGDNVQGRVSASLDSRVQGSAVQAMADMLARDNSRGGVGDVTFYVDARGGMSAARAKEVGDSMSTAFVDRVGPLAGRKLQTSVRVLNGG